MPDVDPKAVARMEPRLGAVPEASTSPQENQRSSKHQETDLTSSRVFRCMSSLVPLSLP